MSNKKIAASAALIGFATFLSRILGFVRDIIIAGLFGTGALAQAFVVSFRIPNLLRDLVGEGASNAAIVPVLSEYSLRNDKKKFFELATILFNLISAVLFSIMILGILFAPIIVRLIAPGFSSDAGKFAITVNLTRFMFPYIFLIGLTAYSMGVLNTLKHFSTPAFGPCLFNISMIACAAFLTKGFGVYSLAIGVLIGGVLQLGVQALALYFRGMKFKNEWRFFHPEAKKIGRLLVPRAVGAGVYQLNVFIDTVLASLSRIVGDGGVAAIYYSNRLIQFPMAIFGVALAQAALPTLSEHAAGNDLAKLRDAISFSLRSIFLVTIPASLGLLILGKDIIEVLFKRGQFGAYSAEITYLALFFYSFGLFAFGGVKILTSGFYSLKDTKTPVKSASIALAVNVVLNVSLMFPLKVGGLALASSIASLVNFLMLYSSLKKKIGLLDTQKIVLLSCKAVLASLIMGIVIYLAGVILAVSKDAAFSHKALRLCFLIACGMISYITASLALKIDEMGRLLRWISKRN